MNWWLLLLGVLPGWAVTGIAGLGRLRELPAVARWVLACAVLLPVPAGLLAPNIMVALGAGVAHGLLLCGLISMGVRLRGDVAWQAAGWGLTVTVLLSVAYTVMLGAERLTHPAWASTSIGLGGALLFGFAAFLAGRLPVRLLWGVLGLAAVAWSGSRGAALALVVGLALGTLVHRTPWAAGLGMLGLLGGGAALAMQGRLSGADGGRELVWSNAWTIISTHPVGGVGRWQLGEYLWPDKLCIWFQELEVRGLRCQDVLGTAQPQVIAHNDLLQTLGEVGVLGSVGHCLLWGAGLVGAWTARQPVLVALLSMPLVMGLVDNPLFMPGPVAGMLAYVALGTALTHVLRGRQVVQGAGVGVVIAALTVLPPLALKTRPDTRPISIQPLSVGLDRSGRYHDVRFNLVAPPGTYRIDMLACRETCSELRVITALGGQQNILMQVGPPVFPTELRLRVLNDEGRTPRELGRWRVKTFGEFAPASGTLRP